MQKIKKKHPIRKVFIICLVFITAALVIGDRYSASLQKIFGWDSISVEDSTQTEATLLVQQNTSMLSYYASYAYGSGNIMYTQIFGNDDYDISAPGISMYLVETEGFLKVYISFLTYNENWQEKIWSTYNVGTNTFNLYYKQGKTYMLTYQAVDGNTFDLLYGTEVDIKYQQIYEAWGGTFGDIIYDVYYKPVRTVSTFNPNNEEEFSLKLQKNYAAIWTNADVLELSRSILKNYVTDNLFEIENKEGNFWIKTPMDTTAYLAINTLNGEYATLPLSVEFMAVLDRSIYYANIDPAPSIPYNNGTYEEQQLDITVNL